jgi:hypothetical protein
VSGMLRMVRNLQSLCFGDGDRMSRALAVQASLTLCHHPETESTLALDCDENLKSSVKSLW